MKIPVEETTCPFPNHLRIFRHLGDVKQFFKPLNLHFGRKWFVVPKTFTILPDDYLILSVSLDVFLLIFSVTSCNIYQHLCY
jgi:hypothetical protein